MKLNNGFNANTREEGNEMISCILHRDYRDIRVHS